MSFNILFKRNDSFFKTKDGGEGESKCKNHMEEREGILLGGKGL